MIYAVVVLMKLYISASTPGGEIANVIDRKNLRLEESLKSLEAAFRRVVDRDRLAPHTKFHYVIQRLGDRFNNIKRRQQEKYGTTKQPTKLSQDQKLSPTTRPHSSSDSMPNMQAQQQAQGLHLLSEVATTGVSNNTPTPPLMTPLQQQHSTTPHIKSSTSTPPMNHSNPRLLPTNPSSTPPHIPQHLQEQIAPAPQEQNPPGNQWYPTHPGEDIAAGMHGVDTQLNGAYDFTGQTGGLEAFDYGLGLGMDGSISGLFIDSWGFQGANAVSGGFFGWHGV
jgi:hypothetical protein